MSVRCFTVVLSAVILVALGPMAGAGGPVAEPDGYRTSNYRAAVPASIAGGQVVTTWQAEQLWREGKAIFVDVLPRSEKPRNLAPGTIWRDKPRDDIPGSIWLPNVGYGVLVAPTEAYFARGLAEATDNNPDRPVVIYCLAECWMSWNAAKRAIAMGYRNVLWYPDGTDGWADAGLPLERRDPVPRPSD